MRRLKQPSLVGESRLVWQRLTEIEPGEHCSAATIARHALAIQGVGKRGKGAAQRVPGSGSGSGSGSEFESSTAAKEQRVPVVI